jgi:hypothetical protein
MSEEMGNRADKYMSYNKSAYYEAPKSQDRW